VTEIMLASTPEDWEVVKLGQYFEQRNEKVSDEDYPPLSVTYDGVVPQMEHVAKSDDRDNRKKVVTGDFVINSRSDRRGASGLSDCDGSVSLINIVLKPRLGHHRFLHYLIRSTAFQQEFYRFGHGIVDDLWTTGFAELKHIQVALPDNQYQKHIADHLDKVSTEIDDLVAMKNKQTSLIKEKENACVTGHLNLALHYKRPFKKTPLPWLPEIPDHWGIKRAKLLFRNVKRPPLDEDRIVTAFRVPYRGSVNPSPLGDG